MIIITLCFSAFKLFPEKNDNFRCFDFLDVLHLPVSIHIQFTNSSTPHLGNTVGAFLGRTADGRNWPSFTPTSRAISSLSRAFIRSMSASFRFGFSARLFFSPGSTFRSKSSTSFQARISSRVFGVLNLFGA